MELAFAILMTALAALATADVSHLGKYNYPAPGASVSNFARQPSSTQSQIHSQIESIRPSVPVASFSIQQNNGQGHSLGSSASAESSGAYHYNPPVQPHYSAPQQQQSYSAPANAPVVQQSYAGETAGAIQNNFVPQQQYSVPAQQLSHSGAAVAPAQQSYLAPAPAPVGNVQNTLVPPVAQQQYSAFSPNQQLSFTGPASAGLQQSYSVPSTGSVQNTYLPPAPQQQYSAPAAPVQPQTYTGPAPVPAPVQHQTYTAPAPVPITAPAPAPQVHQSYSVPTQHSYTAPASIQQQSYSSVGQIQEQSYEVNNQQQQSFGHVEMTSSADNGAYNYQAPVQQPSLPALAVASPQQGYIAPAAAPVQQTYSISSNVQQQSYSSAAAVEGVSYNSPSSIPAQQSYSVATAGPAQESYSGPATTAAVHQTGSGNAGIESGIYNFQPGAQVQQQQQYIAPVAGPLQHAAAVASAGETTSYNNQPAAPAQQSFSNSLPVPQGLEYSVPAPQKISLPTPVLELAAPAPAPEIGTVYDQNGGYVYRKA